jgi:hypothetical protein
MAHQLDVYGRKDWSSGDPLTNSYFRSDGDHAFTVSENLGTFDMTGVTFIGFYAEPDATAHVLFTFKWLTATLFGGIFTQDTVVCDKDVSSQGLLAVKGPAVEIHISQNVPAVNNACMWQMQFMRVGGIARSLNADDMPCHIPSQSVAAATTITQAPNPQFWGDATLFVQSEATDWTYNLRTYNIAGTVRSLEAARMLVAGPVAHRISIPSRRWDLQITNNMGVAKNMMATVMPTQGP